MKLWNRCQFFPNWNSEFPVDFSRLTKNYRLEKLMVIFSPKSKQLFWTYQKNTLPAFMIIQCYMTWHFPFFDSFSQVVFSSMQIKQLFCVSKGILATGGEVERACNKHKQSNSKSVINFNEFDEPWQIVEVLRVLSFRNLKGGVNPYFTWGECLSGNLVIFSLPLCLSEIGPSWLCTLVNP